jgi:hypothetical protein
MQAIYPRCCAMRQSARGIWYGRRLESECLFKLLLSFALDFSLSVKQTYQNHCVSVGSKSLAKGGLGQGIHMY